MRIRPLFVLTLALADWPFALTAQPGAATAAARPAPMQLSLNQAIALAKTSQGAYQNLALDEQVAAQAARATRGLYRPQLGGAAEVRYNAIQPTSILPNFANPGSGERVAVRFGTKFQATAGLTFNQRLYDASALAQRRVDATNQQLAANATLRGRVALVQAVSTAYYEALLRETQLAFAQADHSRAQAVYRDQTARQQAGRALTLDVSTARITVRSAALALDLTRQNILLSKQNLLATLGLPPDNAPLLQLTDPLAALLSSRADTAAWAGGGAGQRPELRQEQLQAELAAATGQVERRGARPMVGVVGYLGANGFNDQLLGALNVPNWYGNSYVALQATVPLLDGGVRTTRIETQRLRQQQAQHRLADLQQTLRYEADNARTQLENAWQTLRVRQQNVAVAARGAELVGLRQQAGRVLPRETLDAEATRQQAQRDYLQAVYDFLVARLDYARATGALGE